MFKDIIAFIRRLYSTEDVIPLHEPRFSGKEKKYLCDCIDSTYVSYLGEYVTRFEDMIRGFTGARYAIATVNGTVALHIALKLSGVKEDHEVITQALTFVATANAIQHCGAAPVFVDVDRETLGMSPEKLEEFLADETFTDDEGFCRNKRTGRRISGCVPMHVFGHPVEIDTICHICSEHNITVVEDAAESLGSFYRTKHTGTFGKTGILSFNGNKIITTGGGGILLTDNDELASRARHITGTAKVPHKWEFIHDEVGYNYRMPNVNAAIGCAQMESLPTFLRDKRDLAQQYRNFFKDAGMNFVVERNDCESNYWLNAVILRGREERDAFLRSCHSAGIMCRPVWRLINRLPMYSGCQAISLENSQWLEDRMVNIPSSVRKEVRVSD